VVKCSEVLQCSDCLSIRCPTLLEDIETIYVADCTQWRKKNAFFSNNCNIFLFSI